MKFGKYYAQNKDPKFSIFYINYKKLKKILKKNNDSDIFYLILDLEIEKLENFCNKLDDENYSKNEISNFLVINYMALFKAVKKHDKKLCRFTKIDFFNWIQETKFYNYYLKLPRIRKKTKLVIFDKDGTLICIDKIFGSWLDKLVDNLSDIVNNKDDLYRSLGYIKEQNKFEFDSVVAKGTNDDIKNNLFDFLKNYTNKNVQEINNLINERWIDIEVSKNDIIQCGDIVNLFKLLKKNNIKIAICTNDDRIVTEKTIKLLGLNEYLDDIKCGDDAISSKPSPEPIWNICKNLSIDVSNTIMVGDTISDIHAGINSKCGKVVGVLSGGYNNTDLVNADYIIDNIDFLPDIL